MRIVSIGSRVFTTSFQLGGVEGLKVDLPLEALTEINKLIEKNDVGLILLSDDIAKDIQKELIEIRAKTPTPLIFELPTPGSKKKKKVDYRALFNQSLGV